MLFLRLNVATILSMLLWAYASGIAHEAQQASAIEEQDKAGGKAAEGNKPETPAKPTRVTLDGPVTVVSQPDPKEQQREAEQRAQTQFENRIQVWTLVFVAVAGFGAVAAYFANKRSADAAGEQVRLLQGEIADARADAVEQQRIANETLSENKKYAIAMGSVATSMATSAASVQESLAISKQIADTNRRIADDNVTAFIATTRAFLHVKQFGIDWGKLNPEIFVVLTNTGRLAALINGWGADCVIDSPLPPVPPRDELTHYGNEGPVGPDNGTVTITAHVPLNWGHDDWNALRHGRKRLSIWGVIEYQTGFTHLPGEIGFGFDYVSDGPQGSYGERFATTNAAGYNYTK